MNLSPTAVGNVSLGVASWGRFPIQVMPNKAFQWCIKCLQGNYVVVPDTSEKWLVDSTSIRRLFDENWVDCTWNQPGVKARTRQAIGLPTAPPGSLEAARASLLSPIPSSSPDPGKATGNQSTVVYEPLHPEHSFDAHFSLGLEMANFHGNIIRFSGGVVIIVEW